MKTLLGVLLIALLALSIAAPVLADHGGSPCQDSGEPGNSDFALHHIIAATAHGSHVPGTHQGFSLCLGLDTGPN